MDAIGSLADSPKEIAALKVTQLLWHASCKELGFVFVAVPKPPCPRLDWPQVRKEVFGALCGRAKSSAKLLLGTATLSHDSEQYPIVVAFHRDSHRDQTDPRDILHRIIWFPSGVADVNGVIASWESHAWPALRGCFDKAYTLSSISAVRRCIDQGVIDVELPIGDPGSIAFSELGQFALQESQERLGCEAGSDTEEEEDSFGRRIVGPVLSLMQTWRPTQGAPASVPQEPEVPDDTRVPQAISKTEELQYEQEFRPTLTVLRSPLYEAANQEFLQGLSHLRLAEFAQAMTCVGCAFESVLKSIIVEKGWEYQPGSDTLYKLVARCKKKKMFPSFYAPIFRSVGALRKKLSRLHGRAKQTDPQLSKEQVEHFVHLAASNILLLESFRREG